MNIPEPGQYYRSHQGKIFKVMQVISNDYVIYSPKDQPYSDIFQDFDTGEYGQVICVEGVFYVIVIPKSLALSRTYHQKPMWGRTVFSWNKIALLGSHKDEKGILVYTQKPSFELIED